MFSSETAFPDELKFGRKHPWKDLYKECSFISDSFTNMAATAFGKAVIEKKIFRKRPIRNKNGL
jgi:hypothetical protein